MKTIQRRLPAQREHVPTYLAELAMHGLDPAAIGWHDDGGRHACFCLAEILSWVRAWQRTGGDRPAMTRAGYDFPPVAPDCDPDQDWLVFERWVAGQPLNWRYTETFGPLPPVETLSDLDIDALLAAVEANLAGRGVGVALAEQAPARVRYAWLRDRLVHEALDIMAPGTTLVLDGCGGDCESCFQKPWCDVCEQ